MGSTFQSSGDLRADRRYEFARDLASRGDIAGAADLFAQAAELAPDFAAAWFELGDAQERLGLQSEAVAAFRKAVAIDTSDIRGARLRLMRLGAEPLGEMSGEYIRAVFDQYAARFDDALTKGLNYRGPELLLAAVQAACAANGTIRFGSAIDLGCGTGLGGEAFRAHCDRLSGVDISPAMVAVARAKRIYDALAVGDIVEFLTAECAESADLVLAADVFAYFQNLDSVAAACARTLRRDGLLAFSVETHDGDGVVLGEKLRYAHDARHVRAAIEAAELIVVSLDKASTRNEAGIPVPGLIAVARRGETTGAPP